MGKMNKILALALAATMVIGSGVTAFADEPVTSGGSNGTGSSEGHVNKHIVSVTLPTIAEGSTPFAYTMDPERLVTETSAAKYSGSTFTDDAKTNGIYFLTGDKAYDTKSTELKVSSQSSADVNLTVDVELVSAETDIPIVAAAPALTGDDKVTDPQLYLALKVGDTTKAVKKDEKVSIDATIAGKDSNFETTVVDGAYVYKAKTGDITWNEVGIQMSGVVSNASAEGLTAPTLKLTWKWTDPAATPAVTAITGQYVTDSAWYALTLPEGTTLTAPSDVSALKVNGSDISTAPTLNGGKNRVLVTRDAVKAALGTDWAGTDTFEFTFTAGGVNYKASNVSKN